MRRQLGGRIQHVVQHGNVADGQPQRVDLGRPLLVGESGHTRAQPVKGRVDLLHAAPLALVCRTARLCVLTAGLLR